MNSRFIIIVEKPVYNAVNVRQAKMFVDDIIEGGDTIEETLDIASRNNIKNFKVFSFEGEYQIKPTVTYEKL